MITFLLVSLFLFLCVGTTGELCRMLIIKAFYGTIAYFAVPIVFVMLLYFKG